MYRRRSANNKQNSINAPFKTVVPNRSSAVPGLQSPVSRAPPYIPDRSQGRLSLALPRAPGSRAPTYAPQRSTTAQRSLSSVNNSPNKDDITIQKVVDKTPIVTTNEKSPEKDMDGDIEIVTQNKCVSKSAESDVTITGLSTRQYRINNSVLDPIKSSINIENPYITSYPANRRQNVNRQSSIKLNTGLLKPQNSLHSSIITSSSPASQPKKAPSNGTPKYYEVMYRKPSSKKHKTWTDDGILRLGSGGGLTLEDRRGKEIGHGSTSSPDLEEDLVLKVGNFEVQVSHEIDANKTNPDTYFEEKNVLSITAAKIQIPKTSFKSPVITATSLGASISSSLNESLSRPVSSGNDRSGFRSYKIDTPRHDPHNPNSIVMKRYPIKKCKHSDTILDVVIDPVLGRLLRPHQIEGVKFLYECVMGFREFNGNGALLADEMGLGKTLMTITLIWTLLKQTPIAGNKPTIERALIVCPVSLMANWKKEFKKWLGTRVGVFIADGKSDLRRLVYGRVYQVIICGYERLRSISEDLKQASIDLIVMDEGHRLKSSNNKSSQAILNLPTTKRVLLTGTPIQNDLSEFFAMIDVINPGILGTYQNFKRDFELPIIKSRQPEASMKDIEIGRLRSDELSTITRMFTLRRTASTIEKYLPPKTESVVFCKPSAKQAELYTQILECNSLKKCVGSSNMSEHLRAITLLKKLCNSPALLRDQDFDVFNLDLPPTLPYAGGKLRMLILFLSILRKKTDEKVVVVSGFTKTLDIIELALGDAGMSSMRLDGSTPNQKRQGLVDEFNKTSQSHSFVFLLSAKSGGTGLNLIGASRLFLFDTDWNPSVDLQAMARVHRDGQKRPVYIYRLLIAGAMDEKIYQRQITKQGLADSFMDVNDEDDKKAKGSGRKSQRGKNTGKKKSGAGTNTFSQAELQDLFKFHPDVTCHTHDLLGCGCCGDISKKKEISPKDSVDNVGETNMTYDELVISRSQTVYKNTNETKKRSRFVISDGDASNPFIISDNEENTPKKPRHDKAVDNNNDPIEIDSDEDGDDIFNERKRLGGWTTAKNVIEGTAPIPEHLCDKTKLEMKGLYEYKHIDPVKLLEKAASAKSNPVSSHTDLETLGNDIEPVIKIDVNDADEANMDEEIYLGDDIMLETLKSARSPITFVFTKSSLDRKEN